MLNWDIKTIPHSEQRYDTCGDYFEEAGAAHFRISDMGNAWYEILVAVHEIVEYALCKRWQVSMDAIDDFDREYEAARQIRMAADCGCMPTETSEPGDDEHAPYYRAHRIATKIERALAMAFGIDWNEYDGSVNAL